MPSDVERFLQGSCDKRTEGNWWAFECKDLENKQRSSCRYEMLGMLEAMDEAFSIIKDPNDIMLLDSGNQGKWRIMTKDQIAQLTSFENLGADINSALQRLFGAS